jgi:hypothetical protein
MRRDIFLECRTAIDLAGRIVKASKDVAREDIGIVCRADKEIFSVCTRENEGVYLAKEMSVEYMWKPEKELDDNVVLALAKAYNLGQPKGAFTKDCISRVECEKGYFVFNISTLEVLEVKIVY